MPKDDTVRFPHRLSKGLLTTRLDDEAWDDEVYLGGGGGSSSNPSTGTLVGGTLELYRYNHARQTVVLDTSRSSVAVEQGQIAQIFLGQTACQLKRVPTTFSNKTPVTTSLSVGHSSQGRLRGTIRLWLCSPNMPRPSANGRVNPKISVREVKEDGGFGRPVSQCNPVSRFRKIQPVVRQTQPDETTRPLHWVGGLPQLSSAPSPALLSPALLSPALPSPALLSPALLSPALLSPTLLSPSLLSPSLLG
ncbi:hypothetical protein DFP72DRAFT_862941 [Ephemerocybe angulata]|uniref:Uncharacterized protein n=1 Tax=Ephemerocybe angulata TaxID=980116 RepID=A0A8H6LT02_9AGAR|nr:hypothetical protein DFP72DRAFT_862941 [Tulosesus angulatus]